MKTHPNFIALFSASAIVCSLSVLLALLSCLRESRAAADDDFLFAESFDVDLSAAFFVSPQGLDTNPGTRSQPYQTIAKGIAAAAADPLKHTVAVASGSYAEGIALANGVNVYGHYQAGSWARDPTHYSIIDGVTSDGNHDRTVVAANITSATIFDGFVIYGAVNAKVGGNSYAIYVSGSNANLQISNNVVFGGHAGPGADGSVGPDGLAGVSGSGRNQNLTVADLAYDAEDATGTGECNTSNNRQFANGGARTCGATSVSGGNGGGNQCPVMSYCDTWDSNFGCLQNATNFHWNNFTPLAGAAGASGGAGGGAAGVGAAPGNDMIQIYATLYGSYVCYPSPDPTSGANGGSGGAGGHGTGVVGCTVASGSVTGAHWLGGGGSSGNGGGNGGGGGGGGAGGGGKCENDGHGHSQCADGAGKDTLGGHGGGGGSGGCGGVGGTGGSPGGGVFGIFIVGGGTAPVVTGNILFGGSGGSGGSGGNGGSGGIGGLGALGGTSGVPVIFCTDVAGRGGDGGNGGDGAGGGGGCGGASFGIYTSGIGTPNYCDAFANNTIGVGNAGSAGAGGLSLVNSGGAGQAGVAATCSFNP